MFCTGMPFDIAIRVYLDSFRLPGESQKINRIMESFGARYHMQCPELFKNPDVVYILAYSTIMLNTDQHNSQVCPFLSACCCSVTGISLWNLGLPLCVVLYWKDLLVTSVVSHIQFQAWQKCPMSAVVMPGRKVSATV